MTVDEAIGEISEHAGHEQPKRDAPPGIPRPSPQKKNAHHDKCDQRERDEKGVVVAEGTEGRAGVGDVDERKEIRNEIPWFVGINEAEDEIFRDLVEGVEGEGEKEDD